MFKPGDYVNIKLKPGKTFRTYRGTAKLHKGIVDSEPSLMKDTLIWVTDGKMKWLVEESELQLMTKHEMNEHMARHCNYVELFKEIDERI